VGIKSSQNYLEFKITTERRSIISKGVNGLSQPIIRVNKSDLGNRMLLPQNVFPSTVEFRGLSKLFPKFIMIASHSQEGHLREVSG